MKKFIILVVLLFSLDAWATCPSSTSIPSGCNSAQAGVKRSTGLACSVNFYNTTLANATTQYNANANYYNASDDSDCVVATSIS